MANELRADATKPEDAQGCGDCWNLFSVLLAAIFWLLRASLPADPLEPGQWLATSSYPVTLALNLVPFAGIAFLWFIGALRDRLGPLEDRFFATVFFGSALLFLAMLFAAAATVGAIILTFANAPDEMLNSTTFRFGRAVAYNVANIYAIKMAGVFMFSTSMVALYTGLTPRWIAVLGFVLAGILLVGSYYISWSFLVCRCGFLLSAFVFCLTFLRARSRKPSPLMDTRDFR